MAYDKKTGNWSENTTGGTVRICRALQLSPEGRKAFNDAVNSDYPVTFTLDPGYNKKDNGINNSKRTKNKVLRSDITIFEKNAKKIFDDINKVTLGEFSLADDAQADTKARVENNPISVDEVIGQEAVHEMKHNTRKNLDDNNNKEKKEIEPNEAEIRSIKKTI